MLKRNAVTAIKKYARIFRISTFIETGTLYGAMIHVIKDDFEKIISIELDIKLANRARELFSKYGHITIIQGDSGIVLKDVLADIDSPCIFWLDAHYSADKTARGKKDTPIMEELECIFNHSVKNHVILIDDVIDFNGKNDYPKLKELKNFILKQRPGWNFIVKKDNIRKFIVCSGN